MAAKIVVPGQRLGRADEYQPGPGTYKRFQHIYASAIGFDQVVPGEKGTLPLIQVVQEKEAAPIPEIDSIVTCKVTVVNPRFAKVDIICVGVQPLKDTFRGMIRVQDVRATEKDKVEIYKCFRPGDIVRARVISLGDARSYLLSTAENELGVIFAESMAGASMVPISWCEMLCPKTNTKEFRKVAKPAPEEEDDVMES
eukprot:Colp12_sorted_trinity150504_noHs@1333